jgi:hypothetical protein
MRRSLPRTIFLPVASLAKADFRTRISRYGAKIFHLLKFTVMRRSLGQILSNKLFDVLVSCSQTLREYNSAMLAWEEERRTPRKSTHQNLYCLTHIKRNKP